MRSALFLILAVLPGLTFAQEPPRAALKYRADLVRAARLVWGLGAPVAVMAAQVQQESGWRPGAQSRYAHGLAQFTPATAEWIAGQDAALAGADTGNPVWALRALARYDRWLYDRIPGALAPGRPKPGQANEPEPRSGEHSSPPREGRAGGAVDMAACDRWWATLRGYNGGLGHWLKEARLAAPSTDRGAIDAQCGQASRHVSHCRENLAYPRQILIKWQPLYTGWGPGVACS